MNLIRRSAVAAALPPSRLAARISSAPLCALDADRPEGWGSPPGSAAPLRSILALEPAEVFEGGRAALSAALRWLAPHPDSDPDAASLIGFLSYELGRELDAPPGGHRESARGHEPQPIPRVWLAGFRAAYHYDPARRTGWVSGSDAGAVARTAAAVNGAALEGCSPAPAPIPVPWPGAPDSAFRSGVEAIRAWIRAGDVYQVNLSRRLESAPVSPRQARELYTGLCRESGAPFGALIDTGPIQVVSNSPERFLRVERGEVETCPIKGTRPRGRTQEEDRALADALRASAKDLAEHVMIVDLERNDLGRICATGSVCVPRLAELRSFATVHHLVSSVRGQLRDPLAIEALIAATFPGGSITGAPKLRAMQIIDSLEAGERGVYTGAIGRFDAAGGVDLSIAIRTAVVRAERMSLQVGGGIVADSDPEQELAETRDKAQAFRRFCEARP
jgi:para-aminobenzoate synthetase component I